MNTEVVCVYNCIPRHEYLMLKDFHQSLSNIGVEPVVLGFEQPWKGLMTKPLRFKEYLESGACKADVIVMPDAYDVIFRKDLGELTDRFLAMNADVVAAGEMNCFPEVGMACDFDQSDPSPLKYLNSGFIVGYPEVVLEILRSMPLDQIGYDRQNEDGTWTCPNDQYFWQLEYFKHRDKMKVDTSGSLCLNLCGVESWQDYDPCAYHFNGGAKEVSFKNEILSICGLD